MIRGQHRPSCFSFGEFLGIRASEVEVEAWDALLDKRRVILRRRVRLIRHHVLFAQRSFQSRLEPPGQRGIVVDGICSLVVVNRRFARCARSGSFSLRNARYCCQDLLPDLRERTVSPITAVSGMMLFLFPARM